MIPSDYSGEDISRRLDPRAKLLVTIALIFSLVLLPEDSFPVYGLYLLLITAFTILSHLSPICVLRRSLVVMPFVLLVAVFLPFVSEGEVIFQRDLGFIMIEVTDMGLGTFIGVLLKSWLSVLALSWLVMSTGFINLVKGLEGLKVPRLFTTLLLFIYRYIFVIFDESVRLRQAMESRSFGSLWLRVKATGSILGVLFIRSYERGERVYQAMLARGYDGQLKGLKSNEFGLADTCFVSFSLVGIALVSLVSLL